MPADSMGLPRLSFTYQEWLSDTSRTFRVRSTELKALDIFIDGYTSVRSASGLRNLRQAFVRWQKTQGDGDAWLASRRNKADAFVQLVRDLKGTDTDVSNGTMPFMSDDMANARLGLLYLFAGMQCKTEKFSIITNGAIDLTGGALGFTGDMLEANGLKTVSEGLQQTARSASVVKTMFKIGSEKTTRTREARRKVSSQNLFQGRPPVLPDNKETREAHEKVSDAAYRIASETFKDIRKKLKDSESLKTVVHELPGSARVACNMICAHFVKEIIPFVSGGMSIANGLVNAVYSGHALYNEYSHGKNIAVLPGHTTDVVREIRHAMQVSTCAGMYEAFKGGTKITVQALSSAAGGPATSLVFALVEAIVSMVWRCYDLHRMKAFFAQAHEQFVIRDHPMALHHRPMAFSRWFRKYAVGTPALSMLALNSGICGDKMRFLNMYDGTDNQIAPTNDEDISKDPNESSQPSEGFKASAKRFAAGANYVDELKVYGALYLEEVDYEFDSDDKLIKACIAIQDVPAEGIKRAVHRKLVAGNTSQYKRIVGFGQKFLSPEV